MASPAFDIYQTDAGYTPVTNDVRRAILAALAEQDRELPELVKITGKSKPTLSNLHMRELLGLGLIEERQHPTDARRKIYRLKARKIGSSNVPIDQLRGAVKHYVTIAPLAYAVPLGNVVDVIAAAVDADKVTLRAQGVKLGDLSTHLFNAATPRELLTAISAFWEREALARGVRIHLDRLELEIELDERLAPSKAHAEAVATVLSGFLCGVAQARLGGKSKATVKPAAGARRFVLALAGP